jgi:hypothetical protein
LLVLCVSALAASAHARALSSRVFVSPLGRDTANCGALLLPCKTFAGAINAVSPGGTIAVLTPGDFGPVTVTKAVTIDAVPGAAWIQATGDAITVNAGASDVVTLRGLTLANASRTGAGVMINSAAAVHIDQCSIHGFINGVFGFAWSGRVTLHETTSRGNDQGVNLRSPSGRVDVAIDHCTFESNNAGIMLQDGAIAVVRGSTVAGNIHGILGEPAFGGAPLDLTVADCVVANNNGFGIASSADDPASSAVVRVSHSTVTGNQIGLVQYYPSPGTSFLLSRQDNTVEGNGQPTFGTIGSYPAQ